MKENVKENKVSPAMRRYRSYIRKYGTDFDRMRKLFKLLGVHFLISKRVDYKRISLSLKVHGHDCQPSTEFIFEFDGEGNFIETYDR